MKMEIVQKWGFGMAPFKPSTEQSIRKAVTSVSSFVRGDEVVIQSDLTGDISAVKGIFNRILKQDQWDWFTVYMYMDFPQHQDIMKIVDDLSALRKAILDKNDAEGLRSLESLSHNRFLLYCENFLSFNINQETPSEYLYILSRREEKDVLKIGMTTRNVQRRVNEINSATGVVFPFSARKVYKVRDSRLVEKGIHALLSEYRIRADREFFRISYKEACSKIEDYLSQHDQFFYSD